MPRKFTKEQQIAGGKIQGVRSRDNKTGIHGLTLEQRHAASVAGGKAQGPIQGPANVSSGEWDLIRNSPESVAGRLAWSRSDENRERVRQLGKNNGPNVDWSRVKTPESLRLGQIRGGLASRHTRHHFNRKLLNPACPLCAASKERGESWWTAEYISTDKRSWN